MSGRLSRTAQRGLSLVEIMVALVVSMVIVIAAASFFIGSSRSRDTQDAASLLMENARFAEQVLTRNIQQVGYQNYMWSTAGAAGRREVLVPTDGQPDIRGFNQSAAGSDLDNGEHGRSKNRVNDSDTLVIRFQGSGADPGDGTMIDCLGRAQPEPESTGDRAYSVFEIRRDSANSEPELKCKYKNNSTGKFSSEVIVRGVEMLQFMYGVDTDTVPDDEVDQWLNAAEVSPTGSTTVVRDWKRVKSVRVGMVLRSPDRVTVTTTSTGGTSTLAPLGTLFSQDSRDALVVDSSDGRLRRVVTFTVNLRNSM